MLAIIVHFFSFGVWGSIIFQLSRKMVSQMDGHKLTKQQTNKNETKNVNVSFNKLYNGNYKTVSRKEVWPIFVRHLGFVYHYA